MVRCGICAGSVEELMSFLAEHDPDYGLDNNCQNFAEEIYKKFATISSRMSYDEMIKKYNVH